MDRKQYDFETVNPRYHTGSGKWDEVEASGKNYGEDVIPFSVADMEFVTAPEIVDALKTFLDHNVLGYAGATEEYYQAVCGWMKKKHDWDTKPEWIVETQGVVDAFNTAVKAYTKAGEGVMLMTPVYYPMYMAIENNKRVLVDTKLIRKGTSYEIDFEDFETKARDENTKLLILCSPHNPCSRIWRREELEKIAKICSENNVFVVSDEIHSDLVMPGYKHTVFAAVSKEAPDNCLVCTAPSKTFNLAGLQTSNIFIPNPEKRQIFLDELCTNTPNPKCSILGYQACRAAYENCEEWLSQVLKIIETNKNLITDFMAKEFPQVQIMDFEATYLLWMDFNGLGIGFGELERINRMEAGLFFDEGYIFGEQGVGFERWNLACPTRYIQAALERMKDAYAVYLAK